MVTDNDITQDETLDEDLAPAGAESLSRPAATSPVDAESLPRPAASPAAASANDARFLSDREAAELRKVYGDPKAKRLIRWFVAGGIIALIAAACAIFQWARTEDVVSWPGLAENQIDDGEEIITLDGEDIGLAYFPHAPGWFINREDGGNFEVYSRVGKYRTVPFRVAVMSRKLEDGWRKTLEQGLEDYCKLCQARGELVREAAVEKRYLNLKTGCGFPVMTGQKTHRVANLMWTTRFIYFRYRDWECVVERSCPTKETAARSLLAEFACLVVYRKTTAAHFAIPGRRQPGAPQKLLRRAREAMGRNLDVADWRAIDGNLRTLLAVAYETDDKDMIAEAADAWDDWRRLQRNWFAQKEFAFGLAYQKGDKKACTALRRLCVDKVDGTDDARGRRSIGAAWEED